MSIAMALLGNKMTDKMRGIVGGAQPYAQQAASGGLGMLLGRANAKWNDKRQLEQQGKLQELQIAGAKELSDYSYGKQLQMWKDTNYSAQSAELEKAGLNKGLIYGMSGGGGTTTGSGGGGTPSGGNAPSGGGEQLALMQAGLGLQMQKAQVDNINANTEKTKADTEKTKGVDTAEAESRKDINIKTLAKLAEETANEKIKGEILDLQQKITQIQLHIDQVTQRDKIQMLEALSNQTIETAEALERANDIGEATKKTTIKQIEANLGETYSRIALNNQQVQESIARTGLTNQQTQKLIAEAPWINLLSGSHYMQIKQLTQYFKNKTENENLSASQQAWVDLSKAVLGAGSGLLYTQ